MTRPCIALRSLACPRSRITVEVYNDEIRTVSNLVKRPWTYPLRLSFREAICTSIMYMEAFGSATEACMRTPLNSSVSDDEDVLGLRGFVD